MPDSFNYHPDTLSSDTSTSSSQTNPDRQWQAPQPIPTVRKAATLAMVETAFLASACSLIWLVNYYFPVGPILRIFFPIPIALIYLRWGSRSAWMGAVVSGLLLSVLMGPPRSIQFLMPYGLMGVQLGACWRWGMNWYSSIAASTLLGTIGFFFRIWLVSILLGDDLWLYVTAQITELADWGFVKLGILAQPNLWLVQALILLMVVINNLIYAFVVHLVAVLLLERLGNSIPSPPKWVEILLD